jgi:predicted MFS family arabinose efflux permease
MLLGFMWFAYLLNYADRQAVFAMFPSLKRDLGMSDDQLGLVGAAFLWVYAIGCPIAGQLADRWSKRSLAVASLAIWSVVTLSTGLATGPVMLLLLRTAMGISESLFMPGAIALTANAHAPHQRSRAIAILTTAQIVGTIGGSAFGGWMADQGRWRGAFFALGILGLLYALPYLRFLRSLPAHLDRSETAAPSGLAFPVLLKTPSFLVLCTIFPVFLFGLWLLYGWLPNFLHDKFSLDQTQAAWNATLALQSATIAGLLGGGWIADRLHRRTPASRLWILAASLLLSAPFLHLIGNAATLNGTRLAAAAFGMFSGLLMGNIFPAAFEVLPVHVRASAVGTLNLCGGLMSGCATLFGGVWKKSLGIDRLMTFTAVGYLAAAALLVLAIRLLFETDHRKAQSSPTPSPH